MGEQILNLLQAIALHSPLTLDSTLDFIIVAITTSGAFQAVKKWRGWENKYLILGMLFLFSGAPAVVNYFLNTPSDNPWVIATQAKILTVNASAAWLTVILPAYVLWRKKIEKAVQYNLDVKSAAMPPSISPEDAIQP